MRRKLPRTEKKLTTAPMLTLPSGTGGLVVYSDASKKGLGCVLLQHGKCNSLKLGNSNYMTYIRSY
jgi:hypothetical protein